LSVKTIIEAELELKAILDVLINKIIDFESSINEKILVCNEYYKVLGVLRQRLRIMYEMLSTDQKFGASFKTHKDIDFFLEKHRC